MKVIFSYHSEDPDTVQGMQWHGIKQRGAQSLRLLSAQTSHMKIPTDAISIDFASNRVSKTIFNRLLSSKNCLFYIWNVKCQCKGIVVRITENQNPDQLKIKQRCTT